MSGRSKGFDAGVGSGLDGIGILTIGSRRCNSRSLIFLIVSTQRVTLRPVYKHFCPISKTFFSTNCSCELSEQQGKENKMVEFIERNLKAHIIL